MAITFDIIFNGKDCSNISSIFESSKKFSTELSLLFVEYMKELFKRESNLQEKSLELLQLLSNDGELGIRSIFRSLNKLSIEASHHPSFIKTSFTSHLIKILQIFAHLPQNEQVLKYRNKQDEENVEYVALSILQKLISNDKLLKELLVDKSLLNLFLLSVDDSPLQNHSFQEKLKSFTFFLYSQFY